MKLANSNGSQGSTWHIYKHKEKDEESLCQKKQLKRVGTRNWERIQTETRQEAQEIVDKKIGSLCKSCKTQLPKKEDEDD